MHTPVSEYVDISTSDGVMPAALSAPAFPRGAVVVVQEAFGVTPHLEAICHRLASVGWLAIAPALFHRQGSPVFAYDDLASVMPLMKTLTREGIETDLDASFGYLHARGFAMSRCAVVGFCMGGAVSMHAAVRTPVGAAVTFYGGGVASGRFGFPSLIDVAPDLQTPWLGLYADLDKGIPFADVELLRTAASTAIVATEVVRYPDAEHGFNCDDRITVYNATAAADAWQRTLAWFDQFIPTSDG
jgi:carboxymethylenebutenolidase